MNTLPKYTREFRDRYISHITNNTKLKKKDIVRMIKQNEYENLLRKISVGLAIARHPFSGEASVTLHYYDKYTHYCVTSAPERRCEELRIDERMHECFIDFEYKGVPYYMSLMHREYPLTLGMHTCTWSLCVYTSDKNVHQWAAKTSGNQRDFSYPIVKIHLNDEGYALVFEPEEVITLPEFNKVIQTAHNAMQEMPPEMEGKYKIDEDYYWVTEAGWDATAKLYSMPSIRDMLSIALHVMHCIAYPRSIIRRDGIMRRRYEKCKIHVVNKHTEDEEVYVPLDTYIRTYNPSTRKEWQGGTHASPCEHDRKGYYRKSRGRGDYILVGERFVFVGEGKGNYSFVKPTHINGNKSSALKVYKV